MSGGENSGREHLFINYATEDSHFTDWLACSLAGRGYKVWYDRYELLGGESYPKNIDKAIKERTFRFLSVLSHNSIDKENPRKEREMAVTIAINRGIDFIIPLNLDGLSPLDINWRIQDLTWIPFYGNWKDGLNQLLKKLEKIDCPNDVANGRRAVCQLHDSNSLLAHQSETVYSNLLPVIRLPNSIKRYRLQNPATESGLRPLSAFWAFKLKDKNTILSYSTPPASLASQYGIDPVDQMEIGNNDDIFGLPTEDLVKYLVSQSLGVKCRERGMLTTDYDDSLFYFPASVFEGDKLHYRSLSGSNTWLYATNTKRYRTSTGESGSYRYYLGFRFRVRQFGVHGLCIHMRIGAHATDTAGGALTKRSRSARVRGKLRDWYNNDLLKRQIAFVQHLSKGLPAIVIGDGEGETVEISSEFLTYTCPVGVSGDEGVQKETEEPKMEESEHIIDDEEPNDSDEEEFDG